MFSKQIAPGRTREGAAEYPKETPWDLQKPRLGNIPMDFGKYGLETVIQKWNLGAEGLS